MDSELTDDESRALARLVRAQENWPKTRWLLVALSGLNAISGYRSYFVHQQNAEGLVIGLLAFACLLLAITQWNGNPGRVLLLRLMRDRVSKVERSR